LLPVIVTEAGCGFCVIETVFERVHEPLVDVMVYTVFPPGEAIALNPSGANVNPVDGDHVTGKFGLDE
jgi:hypothetical protein